MPNIVEVTFVTELGTVVAVSNFIRREPDLDLEQSSLPAMPHIPIVVSTGEIRVLSLPLLHRRRHRYLPRARHIHLCN